MLLSLDGRASSGRYQPAEMRWRVEISVAGREEGLKKSIGYEWTEDQVAAGPGASGTSTFMQERETSGQVDDSGNRQSMGRAQ